MTHWTYHTLQNNVKVLVMIAFANDDLAFLHLYLFCSFRHVCEFFTAQVLQKRDSSQPIEFKRLPSLPR